MKLREIDKLLGEITQGDWVAISLDGYPIVGVKHPPVDDSKKWQLKVISVLTTEQMKGLGKVVKIELDDEDRANLGLIAAAPTVIRQLLDRIAKLETVIEAGHRVIAQDELSERTSMTYLVGGGAFDALDRALAALDNNDEKETTRWK